MYNELVQKVSEAQNPFEPMGKEEMADVAKNNPLKPFTIKFTFTSDVDAKDRAEAQALAIEDLQNSMSVYRNHPEHMFRMKIYSGVVEATTPFAPMGDEERKKVTMSPQEIVKWLKVLPPYIEESEMQWNDEETNEYFQQIVDAVYEAIDYIEGKNVPREHSRV